MQFAIVAPQETTGSSPLAWAQDLRGLELASLLVICEEKTEDASQVSPSVSVLG